MHHFQPSDIYETGSRASLIAGREEAADLCLDLRVRYRNNLPHKICELREIPFYILGGSGELIRFRFRLHLCLATKHMAAWRTCFNFRSYH